MIDNYVLLVLTYSMAIIGLTGMSISYAYGNNIDCEQLKAHINYTIISTICIANNTEVIVEIVNCDNISNVAFTILGEVDFTLKKSCWYSSNDVHCRELKSDSIYHSNISVVYKEPLELYIRKNYIYCRNLQGTFFSMGNAFFSPLFALGLLTVGISCLYHFPCKRTKD